MIRKTTRNLRSWLAALAVGAACIVQYHLAQFSTRFDTFYGDRGDARGFLSLCEHWYLALQGKVAVLSPEMFYPVRGTLAYSELVFGFGLFYSAARALGLEMFSALEAVVIVINFLNYLACFVLLYRVLQFRLLASIAASAFFAFNSPKFFQTGHLQLQFVLCLPIALGCVLLFVKHAESISRKRAFLLLALAGAALNVQMLTAFYMAWFLVLWSFLFLFLALCLPRSRRFILDLARRFWPSLIAATLVTLLLAVPFLAVYLPMLQTHPWYTFTNVSEMIPRWWSLLTMGHGNYLWGWLIPYVRPEPPPVAWGELTVGIGVVTSLVWLALTVYGIRILIRYGRRVAPSSLEGQVTAQASGERARAYKLFLGLTIVTTTLFYLLGMQYGDGFSPWKYVYKYFPGAGAVRAMSRYVIFLTLPISIAFGYALSRAAEWIERHGEGRRRVWLKFALAALAVFSVVEQFGVFKVGGTGFSKRAERAYLHAMAAKLPKDCTAFYVAARPDDKHNAFEYQYDAMLIANISRIPTLNGSSSQFPEEWFGLYDVKHVAYEEKVRAWIARHRLEGKVCRLELWPPVEAFDPKTPSPLDASDFFVRQHYKDFFEREPTAEELTHWLKMLDSCPRRDASCDRLHVSSSIFRAPEFAGRGAWLYRLYRTAAARPPTFDEFTSDMRRLRALAEGADEERARTAFAGEFAERLASAGATREGRALKAAAESREAVANFNNSALVFLHYVGYLRRAPEAGGEQAWTDFVNRGGDLRTLTNGFVNTAEYRQRFLKF
ncbi:MAG TPA: hypothetical protein VGV59_02370 [Pyrinomonadaceae bacterium]|nr:hypothetical protein [Pyrinomonadaceae bacterium]